MTGFQSKTFRILFKIFRKDWSSIEGFYKSLKSAETYVPSKKIQRRFSFEVKLVNGFPCYTMKPMLDEGSKHIIFLHGGGYVHEISSFHWSFLGKFIDELGCTITIPIYPLAIKCTYKESFSMLLKIYENIISNVDPNEVAIMGDSAGGGMALALAQYLKEKKINQPKDIILLSPWLDISLSNPEIKKLEIIDPILAVPGLKEAGKMYSGDSDMKNYLLSPINGDQDGLGKITIFIGTDELLLADARKLKNKLDLKEIKINYFEYQSVFHDWFIFPIPKARKAFKEIIKIIKEEKLKL